MQRLTITKPDDWHLHLRDGAALESTVPPTARRFSRAIVMPNLAPPVTTTADAVEYRERILRAVPVGLDFEPLMTLYLTDDTPADEIDRAMASRVVSAVKLYPAGATTNSASGVTDIEGVYPVLAAMERLGMPLLVHGEVTDPDVDIFDRERVFLERVLAPITERFTALKIVLEHVTTADGIEFVRAAPATVAATITAHHLLCNRNAIFEGGLRPHNYCLPVLKRERHRRALVEAAVGGERSFFLGTDSAPHTRSRKETACGCAGVYTAHAALELYAEVFDAEGALDRFEAFASFHGPDFYRLPRNTSVVTLERRSWNTPPSVDFGGDAMVPFRAGARITWSLLGL